MIVEIFPMHRELEGKKRLRSEAGDSTEAGSPERVEETERTFLFCHCLDLCVRTTGLSL